MRSGNLAGWFMWLVVLLPGTLLGGSVLANTPVWPAATDTAKVPPELLSDNERDFLARHPVLRVALAREDYSPFQSIDNQGVLHGYSLRVLSQVAVALGLRLEAVFFDQWSDVLAAVRERRADVIPYLGHTSQRTQYLSFTRGLARDPSALVGRTGEKLTQTNPLLNGTRVAVGRGYVEQSALPRLFPQAIEVPVAGIEQGLRAVSTGAADLYLGGLLSAQYHVEKHKLAGLEVQSQVLVGSGWAHLAVRSDWSVLAKLINRLATGQHQMLTEAPTSASAAFLGESRFVQPVQLVREEINLLDGLGTLRVGAVRGLLMLNHFDEEHGHGGIGADYTALLAHSLGILIQVEKFDSVAEMLDAARQGRIDLIPLLTRTQEREREFRFSRPYLRMPYFLVTANHGTAYWSLAGLAGKTLALAREHPLLPIVRRQYPQIQVLEVANGSEALKAVADGHAQAAVEVKLYALRQINADYHNRLHVVEAISDLPSEFGFAAPLARADLIPLIDRALAAVAPSEANRIEQRWIAAGPPTDGGLRRSLTLAIPVLVALITLTSIVAVWNRRLALETRQRRVAEQQLIDMTDRLNTGVYQFQTTQDGVDLIFANQMVRDLYQIDSATNRLSNAQLLMPIAPSDRAAVIKAWSAAMNTGDPYEQVYRFRYPQRGDGWISSQATSRRTDDGQLIWSGILLDVSEDRALHDQLRSLLSAKDMFVATASHELKTPLHGLSLILQWLSQSRLDGEQKQRVAEAEQATRSLDVLIEDLLDLSRIEAGRLTLTESVTDLPDLIRSVVASFDLARRNKGLRIVVDIDPWLPRRVLVDALRLRQVLVNLVGNALKHTHSGRISLTLTIRSDLGSPAASQLSVPAENRLPLLFVVADTGEGIPHERLASIFEPFSAKGDEDLIAGRTRDAGIGSSGLGLSICKHIVELMGGTISLLSTRGLGTTVSVALDLVVAEDAAAIQIPKALTVTAPTLSATENALVERPVGEAVVGDQRRLADLRVLLVDDDRLSRSTLANLLGQLGAEVVQAQDGKEALEILDFRDFDAVVSDLRMPRLGGVGLARAIRKHAAANHRHTCAMLIALTAGNGIEDTDHETPGLFDHVLTKPVQAESLVVLLRPPAVQMP